MHSLMLKEIYQQKEALQRLKQFYFIDNEPVLPSKMRYDFNEIKFIASGSSYNAGLIGNYLFSKYTNKRSSFDYSSEFIKNCANNIKKDTLYCFISQSGETYDTKLALELVKSKGAMTLSVTNNPNSFIYINSDIKIDSLAGTERAIAATKSFLTSVVCVWMIAVSFAIKEGKISLEEEKDFLDEAIKASIETMKSEKEIKLLIDEIYDEQGLILIGEGFPYIISREFALKIKETSYINANAYPTGEFIHGHTALLNRNKKVIALLDETISETELYAFKKMKDNFSPDIIAISPVKTDFKNTLKLNNYKSQIAKITALTVICQLLSYHIALKSGNDIDNPEGLYKIVK